MVPGFHPASLTIQWKDCFLPISSTKSPGLTIMDPVMAAWSFLVNHVTLTGNFGSCDPCGHTSEDGSGHPIRTAQTESGVGILPERTLRC